jgi:nucleoside-diphosphate-sugar epimerase
MSHLLIFGMGYTATRLATQLRAQGWQVTGITRDGRNDSLCWGNSAIEAAIASSTHILSSVPPAIVDPVLDQYGSSLSHWRGAWLGYLSATGVYGDARGDWVDEASPLSDTSRNTPRALAEAAWRMFNSAAPIHIFRLPGIYGPGGRSALDRVREGRAHRIANLGDHVFCRIHVDDIVSSLIASLHHPAGPMTIYNVTDDEPAPGNAVVEYACDLLGLPYPPLLPIEEAGLSAQARSFYTSGWRRVRNDKIKRDLGVPLRYPTYREGLLACLNAEYGAADPSD